jgi:hypothetical protein
VCLVYSASVPAQQVTALGAPGQIVGLYVSGAGMPPEVLLAHKYC